MKKRLLVVLLAALCAAVLGLIGYIMLNGENTVRDPVSIYRSAISNITFKEDMVVSITEKNEITTGNETFILETQKKIQYDVDSADTLRVYSLEVLLSDDQTINITEILADGQLYMDINDIRFKSDKTEDDYLGKTLPPVVIDEQLYKNISGIRNRGKYTISFSNPSGLERWVIESIPEDYAAEGKSYINQNGVLTSSCYTASYTINDVNYRTTVNIEIFYENIEVSAPNDTSAYTQIENPEALRTLEIVCGYLLQAKNISSDYTDNIYIQAMGDRRTQSIKSSSKTADDLSAMIETNIFLTNDSRADQITEYSKIESYTNGQYTISTNGEAPIHNADITAEEMRSYLQSQLVSTVMLPQYINSIDISQTGDRLIYTFGGNQAFANFLVENACRILYQDPKFLEDTTDTIIAKKFHCYLTVDKNTLLPIESGIIFTGQYKTSGVPYQLEYHAEQAYHIPN